MCKHRTALSIIIKTTKKYGEFSYKKTTSLNVNN